MVREEIETRESVLSPQGEKTTTWTYDEAGNLTSREETGYALIDGVPILRTHKTEYQYTDLGQLEWIDGPRVDVTNRTDYIYDDFSRLSETDSPDTGTTTYAYDEAGNLTEKTDARGTVTSYTYDALNRLTRVDFPEDPDVIYAYDDPLVSYGIGRLTGMEDPSGSCTYHYDPLGNTAREEKTIKGVFYRTAYRYDKAGELTGMTLPSGRSIDYGFDDARRVERVATAVGSKTKTVAKRISYLPFGPPRRLKHGNGAVLSEG